MSNQSSNEIDFSPLLKAQSVFNRFLVNSYSEQEKAGTIQAFEFCYELSWKLMKKILAKKGLNTGTPKDVFRAAAVNGLIDDPEIWFAFIEKRNLTVHTYHEEYLEEIIKFLPKFKVELDKFINKIKKIII